MRNPRLLKIWANGDLDPCHRSRFWRTRQSRSKNDTVSILSILFQNQTGEPGKRISVSDPEVVPLSMMDSKIQGVGWINERRFQSKTLGSTQYINTGNIYGWFFVELLIAISIISHSCSVMIVKEIFFFRSIGARILRQESILYSRALRDREIESLWSPEHQGTLLESEKHRFQSISENSDFA